MNTWTILGAVVVGLAAYLLFSGFIKTYRTYRGVRVITCPENHQAAAVSVAAFDAAKWFAVSGDTDIHLRECSRWPERSQCDQACLREIESSPMNCLVSTMVKGWYAGKACHFCGKEIGEIVWHERPPGVLRPDGTTAEWKGVAPQDLPEIFKTCEPVCWACHVVEDFRREHPNEVVQRARMAVPHKTIEPTQNVY